MVVTVGFGQRRGEERREMERDGGMSRWKYRPQAEIMLLIHFACLCSEKKKCKLLSLVGMSKVMA